MCQTCVYAYVYKAELSLTQTDAHKRVTALEAVEARHLEEIEELIQR